MYRKNRMPKGFIKSNKAYEGNSIEQKIRQATIQGIPLDEGIPMIFPPDANITDPSHNIRTDKWDIAQTAIGEISKSKAAKGDGKLGLTEEKPGEGKASKDAGSIDGTSKT